MIGSILVGLSYLMLIGLVFFFLLWGKGIEFERKWFCYVFGSVEFSDVVEVVRLFEMECGWILIMVKVFGMMFVVLMVFLIVFVVKGVFYIEFFVVYVYWFIIYIEIFIFLFKEFKKKKLLLIILLIFFLFFLFVFGFLKMFLIILFMWFFGSFFLDEFFGRDLVVVRIEKGSYFVFCVNGELIVGLIGYGGIM